MKLLVNSNGFISLREYFITDTFLCTIVLMQIPLSTFQGPFQLAIMAIIPGVQVGETYKFLNAGLVVAKRLSHIRGKNLEQSV